MTHVAVGGWVNRRNWESIETPVWRERGRREEGTRKEGDGGRFVFNPFGVECWNPDGTGGERQHEFWKNGGRTCVEKEGGILSGGGRGRIVAVRGEGALGATWKCCYLGKRSAGSTLCLAPLIGAVRKREWRKRSGEKKGERGLLGTTLSIQHVEF